MEEVGCHGGKLPLFFLQSFEMHVVERQVSTQLCSTFHVCAASTTISMYVVRGAQVPTY